MAAVLKMFLPSGKARNFSKEGWTGNSLICPSGKISTVSLSRMQGREAHYPNARLLRLTKYGLEPVTVEQTDHYKVMREFCVDPAGFVDAVIAE
jgi:hypothetical protein